MMQPQSEQVSAAPPAVPSSGSREAISDRVIREVVASRAEPSIAAPELRRSGVPPAVEFEADSVLGRREESGRLRRRPAIGVMPEPKTDETEPDPIPLLTQEELQALLGDEFDTDPNSAPD
jgi:hypothetical protein